jgi:hypothetical protein
MLVITVLVIARPERRTVTPLYHAAVECWWHRQPLYSGPAGMNYLPHFAVLFTPYHLAGRVLGDLFWRWTAAGGLAAGLWLFCGALAGRDRLRAFVVVSALSLPLSLPALQNGQANAQLAAAFLLAGWFLQAQGWGTAVLFLGLATCIKPLGLAAMALAWAVEPRLWWRLACGLVVFVGLPFLAGPPGYVADQYLAAAENLRQCAVVTEHRFADLNGLLRTLGIPLTGTAATGARALAGVGLMFLCRGAARREPGPIRALVWLSVTAAFLMLFNPMTEANSYVILAPALALVAWHELSRGARWLGWLLVAMALTMGLLPNALHPFLDNRFALVWHPAMTLAFVGVIVGRFARRDPRKPRPEQARDGSP